MLSRGFLFASGADAMRRSSSVIGATAIAVALVCRATPAAADDPAAPPAPPPPSPGPLGPLLAPFAPRDAASDAKSALEAWGARPAAILLQGGSGGGPLGYGGLSFEYAPVPWFIAGVGGGFSAAGPTAAFMPRLRLPLTRWLAIGAAVPFSAGPYVARVGQQDTCSVGCEPGFTTTRTWNLAFWAHLEPNIELRLPYAPALALRLYGGSSFLLNTRDDQCVSTLPGGCPSTIGEQIWYGGFAVGYAW